MKDITVVKLGGAEGNDGAALAEEIVKLVGLGNHLVLVHGGSAERDRVSRAMGREPTILTSPSGYTGRRCDRTDVEIFAQATGLVNRRLVERLRQEGVDAFGLSGLDGGLVMARRKAQVRAVQGGRTVVVRDQWTGSPRSLQRGLLEGLLGLGKTPVIAPIAGSEEGEMLNVDGDRMAATVAAGIGARELVILTNVNGLRADVDDPASLIAEIAVHELDAARKLAQGSMKKKLLGAEEALAGGVRRVIIASSANASPLRSALEGGGTHITATHAPGRLTEEAS